MELLLFVLPSELGRLTRLASLAIGANGLLGEALPSELGRLRLQSLSVDASSLKGQLPLQLGLAQQRGLACA